MSRYGFVYYLQQMRISNLDFYTRHYYKNILKEDLDLFTLYSLLEKQILSPRSAMENFIFDEPRDSGNSPEFPNQKKQLLIILINKYLQESSGVQNIDLKLKIFLQNCSIFKTEPYEIEGFINTYFNKPEIEYSLFKSEKLKKFSITRYSRSK